MLDRIDGAFAEAVLAGLSRSPKRLEPKWFYDARGSELFDAICELEEYYPTRTERRILQAAAAEIAEAIGPGAVLYEPGAGSATKARLLLDALEAPALFAPADISIGHLEQAAERLREEYPDLRVEPFPIDFTVSLAPPREVREAGPVVVFFPGSTIGNLDPAEARALLSRFRREAEAAHLLIGVDLVKDERRLVAAYDDAKGVTAAFNRNLLARINRELGGDFDLDAFRHVALFDAQTSRIEMHLESLCAQSVTVLGHRFDFAEGERILTEHSYKYTLDGFAGLAAEAGWSLVRRWTDAERLFGVFLFREESSTVCTRTGRSRRTASG